MTSRLLSSPISDLNSAIKHFVRWTGFSPELKLYKTGSHIATIFRRPEPPYEQYCVTFKREWYKNFGYHFPQCPEKDWGQITSLNLLRTCERQHIAWLVAVMTDGIAYKIEVLAFLKYYEENGTDVPHLPGEVACPIRMWQRMFPK